jgi:protein-tyrosine-phosphatase/tRNA A37 threonylcarbamoyladenosine synthetase subunit TsaC/SUA5/YrdC
MHNLLDWKNSEDQRDIVHIVVQALVEGRRVALPADTGYHLVSSGLNASSADHFSHLIGEGRLGRCSLFLRSSEELLDYVPDLSNVASRIAARGWPGPLTLDLPIDPQRGLISRLPKEIQALVVSHGRTAFRVASQPVIQHALRLMSGPILAAQIKQEGAAVTSADGAGERANVSIVVDDGLPKWDGAATCLRIDKNVCQVIEQGVVPEETLYRVAQYVVLLVCTGNTCRSPMAEVMLKEKLRTKFGRNQPVANPVHVASAGISAYPGGTASPEAHQVMAVRGLDLSEHQSQAVTEHALMHADLILTMTHGHREAILDRIPEIRGKVHVLSGGSADVSDPFGGSEAAYQACADQIDALLDLWVERIPEDCIPEWLR